MSERHVIIEDEVLAQGFTQIPNQILRRSDVPPGAKLTYMVLLSYAWQKDHAYPGQDRLAADMGVSERSVITYLKQLVDTGLISIRRRGLGMTNVYIIHRLPRSEESAVPEVKDPTPPEVKDVQTKKTQVKKTQGEESSNSSIALTERETISWVIEDIAREFNDQAPVKSSVSRTVRLYGESGKSFEAFLDLLQAARLRTKKNTGSIKSKDEESGTKRKMAYFFSIVENLIESDQS